MAQLDFSAVRGANESPEIALWRAVISQAKGDLSGRRNGTGQNEVEKVIAWVGSTDFHKVCMAASVDPSVTEKEFRRVIEEMEKDQ